jgi:SpoVK/Ycf46/Vps4 family AAA+-type ATPase
MKVISSLLLSMTLSLNAYASGPSCEQIFEKQGTDLVAPKKKPTVEEAIQNIKQYRETVMGQILERDFVIEPFLTALIAKEHILLVGPPGNAKTTLAKILMDLSIIKQCLIKVL